MVQKIITSPRNVIDFARYLADRNAAGTTLAISARLCRYCSAALSEGESEDECSSAFNIHAPGAYVAPRKFYAD